MGRRRIRGDGGAASAPRPRGCGRVNLTLLVGDDDTPAYARAAIFDAWQLLTDDDPHERLPDIALATHEAVVNVRDHAGLGPEDCVHLTVTAWHDRVEVVVMDEGEVLTTPAGAIPLDAERGRGLALIERLVDDGVYQRGDGTNVLFLRSHLSPPGH